MMKKWIKILSGFSVGFVLTAVIVGAVFAQRAANSRSVSRDMGGLGQGQEREPAFGSGERGRGGVGRRYGAGRGPANESGYGTIDQPPPSEALGTATTGELSAAEVKGILYMREEEKLARDVYLALYQEWEMPIFQKIASSEASHMDAVKTLIDRYGLEDPAAGKDVGVFVNETLQELYDRTVEEGRQSLASALRVGAAIEEIDIVDLEEYVAETDKADIQRVYENLMRGSRNHLRAFTSVLKRQVGESYQPQHLDQDAYDEIVSTGTERGRRGRR
jgi:hypothetical protein